MHYIHEADVEGKQVLCFDTGLDPRSFARTKMSQCMTELGHIVFSDGSISEWKAAGVIEHDGYMRVYGPLFDGERLDLLIKDAQRTNEKQIALQAIVFWIRAKLLLGETHSALSPGAAFISPEGNVFFGPENLSNRCLFLEKAEPSYFYSPDLTGMEAIAFCAGVMLYKLLSGAHPYPDQVNAFQDMRDGILLKPGLAIPGLDPKLCGLIQSALYLPVAKMKPKEGGAEILNKFMKLLVNSGGVVSVSSLFHAVTEEEQKRIDKETKLFIGKKNSVIKTKRFIAHNKQAVVISAAVFLFVLLFAGSMIRTRINRPTTEGMCPYTVVNAYFEAFNSLDHLKMEACLMGADQGDVNLVMHLFVIDRIRQAHEMGRFALIPASLWQEMGNELPAPNVFGITDLSISRLSGSEDAGMFVYRADYKLWFPHEPTLSIRSDELTLRLDRRNNWRITEILRTETLIEN